MGQRLAWIAAEGTNIDTTSGREHSKRVEPETFPESIAPYGGSKEECSEARRHTDGSGEISFWTDGLRLNSGRRGTSFA